MKRTFHPSRQLVALVACFAWAAFGAVPAHASGPKKLKQPSSFPLVISQPGSYVLVSNITVPDANTTAIAVQSDNVTIDLNGFSILGPTVCSGGPPVTGCTPTGSGIGIDATGRTDVSVVNGTVKGLGQTGVSLGKHAHVERVRAANNGQDGILVAYPATLVGNMATENGGDAISASEGALVSGNTCRDNAGTGIVVGNGSTIVGNSSMYNGACGLNGGGDFGYTDNVFRTNTFGSVCGGGTDMGHNDCNGSTTCP
jgi:hypothetical protein